MEFNNTLGIMKLKLIDWAYFSSCEFYNSFNDYEWDILSDDTSQNYVTIRLAL